MRVRPLLLPLLAFLCVTGCATPVADDTAPTDDRFALAAAYAADKSGDALIIYEAGEVVRAEGQNGFDLDAPHFLASGTKSFAGVMALAAEADGLLDLCAPIANVVPAWADNEAKADITLYELLTLTSGLDPIGVGRAPSFADALAGGLVHPLGTGFRYGPGAFQAFGGVMTEVLAGEDPTAYLQRRILGPIGASVDRWNRIDGDAQLAGGAHMTARDWLRFGRLVLQDGTWEGEQILPSGLQDALLQAPDAAPAYGLTFWLNPPVPPNHSFLDFSPVAFDGTEGFIYADGPNDILMAAGLFNQRLYVVPSRDMVVVRFGRADPSWNDAEFLARVLEEEALERPQAAVGKRLADGSAVLTRVRLAQLASALELTPEQREALQPILHDHMQAMAPLLRPFQANEDLRRLQRLRLLRQIRRQQERTDEAIEALLTDDQVARYRELRAEERAEFRERFRGEGP
ncbi:MAG: serine hydrolase [Bacteroidetes bacterium]|jgi:CubicO group peptidase (beta-lactamase class C family)|nr:serine hydrolase [Bacteroidota bacterium]